MKRIKSHKQSTMINDLLRALTHVSLNGSPIHNKKVDSLFENVTDICVTECHCKLPKLYYERRISSSASTQTGTIKFLSDSPESSIEISRLEYDFEIINQNDFFSANLEFDDSSSEGKEDNNGNKEEYPV